MSPVVSTFCATTNGRERRINNLLACWWVQRTFVGRLKAAAGLFRISRTSACRKTNIPPVIFRLLLENPHSVLVHLSLPLANREPSGGDFLTYHVVCKILTIKIADNFWLKNSIFGAIWSAEVYPWWAFLASMLGQESIKYWNLWDFVLRKFNKGVFSRLILKSLLTNGTENAKKFSVGSAIFIVSIKWGFSGGEAPQMLRLLRRWGSSGT